MTRRTTALAATASALTLAIALSSGDAGAARKLARVVMISPSTTFHVNRTTGVYSGTMVHEVAKPGLGGGFVPKGMADGARNACHHLYAAGRAKGLNPHVGLLWYRGTSRIGAVANFGYHPTTFGGGGNWHTQGIASVSIMKGDKFTATGGFWSSDNNSVQTHEETKAKYKGHTVRVECNEFHATRHWPF